jgi:hypothetical protein
MIPCDSFFLLVLCFRRTRTRKDGFSVFTKKNNLTARLARRRRSRTNEKKQRNKKKRLKKRTELKKIRTYELKKNKKTPKQK